jgi:hypothetical protein
MFGGRDGRAGVIAEHGCEFGRRHRAVIGNQLAVALAVQSGPQENNAGIGFGWMERQGNG